MSATTKDPDIFDDELKYDVRMFAELPMLSNLLLNFAMYRAKMGPYWPTKIVVHKDNRLSINVGEDVRLIRADNVLRNAFFNWLFEPFHDPHNGERTPTIFKGKRQPVPDKTGLIYRSRKD